MPGANSAGEAPVYIFDHHNSEAERNEREKTTNIAYAW